MQFKDIPGLTEVKRTLLASVKNQHVAHAQLFYGPEGSASLAMAAAFATYLNCEDKQEDDACGTCAACVKNNKLIHPDLHFFFPFTSTKSVPKDPSSAALMKEWREFFLANPYGNLTDWGAFLGTENKQLNFPVEESRRIIQTLTLKSFEGTFKIIVLWMPEIMNAGAANALLKILEEPPANTIFLLAANDIEKIITTILSRTQKVKIRSFTDDEITAYLQDRGVDEGRAKQLGYLSDGSMNQALHLIEEVQEDSHEMFREWMRTCYKRGNFKEIIGWSDQFQGIGKEAQKSLLTYGLNILRDSLVYRHGGKELLRLQHDEKDFIEKFSKVLPDELIEIFSAEFNKASYHIERNANARILFLDLSLKMNQYFNLN